MAINWNYEIPYGFISLGNRAVSYFLGLHAQPDYPQSILAGDRNLLVDMVGGTCITGIPNPAQLHLFTRPTRSWADTLHGESGNLLLSSGAVLQLSDKGLASALTNSASPFSDYLHLLFPKTPGIQN